MKTRNPHHGLLHGLFTLVLPALVPLLAVGSVACGAAPDDQGEKAGEQPESTQPSPAADGTDGGEPAAKAAGELEGTMPAEPVPVGTPPARTLLQQDQAPAAH